MSLNAHLLRTRYLIDDASIISDDDARSYLAALFAIASSDELVSAEEALVASYAETLGIQDLVADARELSAGSSLTTLLAQLTDAHVRRCLFRDAVMVAHADGGVTGPESNALTTLAAVLELPPDAARDITAWVRDDLRHMERLHEVLGA